MILLNQSSPKLGLSKYRGLLIAVSLFLVFNLLVLALNFYTSYTLDNDAVSINLSGRQRMLSQRTAKALFNMQVDAAQGQYDIGNITELKKVVALFDSTLNAFAKGGEVLGGDEKPVYLRAAETAEEQALIKQALQLWGPYKIALEKVVSQRIANDESLDTAANLARTNNLTLLKLMNTLTSKLESATRQKANTLKIIQTVALIISLILFANIVLNALGKLRNADKIAEKAQRETTEILHTVKEGLFLLDPQFLIGSQYSSSLNKILQQDIFEGFAFMPLLKSMVDEATYDATFDYITLLFGNRVKENLVISLNPLSTVKVESANKAFNKDSQESKYQATRYLSFQFNRVVENKVVLHLLVTVQDITERVTQSAELATLKGQATINMAMLTRILNADQFQLRQFLNNTAKALEHINTLLATFDNRAHPTSDLINQCFRTVHGIKGEASALGFEAIEMRAHQFEEALAQLRNKTQWTSEDFLSLPVFLNGMFDQVQQVNSIIEGIHHFGSTEQKTVPMASESIRHNLMMLANQVAQNQQKEVTLEANLNTLNQYNNYIANELQQLGIQLIRNAVSHGIETAQIRLEKGKPRQGKILLNCKILADGGLSFSCRDDGAGIVPERIRDAMVQSGVYTRSSAAALSDKEIVLKLFDPGFSTSPNTNRDAGRGVGLDLIQAKINDIGGRLSIHTKPDEYTQFTITLPATAIAGAIKLPHDDGNSQALIRDDFLKNDPVKSSADDSHAKHVIIA